MQPNRLITLAASALILLSAGGLTAIVSAHPGNACGLQGNKLEGECYTTADPACDPDGDAEHQSVLSSPASSGGAVASLPNVNCVLNFGTINFASGGKFTTCSGWIADAGTGSTVRYTVMVDGAAVGQVTFSPTGGTLTLLNPATVTAGSHSVKIVFALVSGQTWVNPRVDYCEFKSDIPPPPECTNANAPTAPGRPKADGLGSGAYGWVDFDYTFTATGSTDADGHPITYSFEFGDGDSGSGLSVEHAFAATGTYSVVVTATDVPGPGCTPKSTRSAPYTFTVIEDFGVELDSPTSSCVANTPAPSVGVNVIVLNCKAAASVAADVPSLVKQVAFRVDGDEFKVDTSAPYSATLNTFGAPGQHELDACATAKNDKHAREFCSEPFAYLGL
jgi:hypothetical protein